MEIQADIDPVTSQLKRTFDLLAASTGILITAPLLAVIALAIKTTSLGPIIFRQQRIGRATPSYTNLFYMYKFRTMIVNAEATSGAVWSPKEDPRITSVGQFLRKTRLDEMPQLWNVLLGDMSLIGPRPERPGFYQKLEAEIPFFAERTYAIRPGITGLAQVNQGYDTCIEDVRRKVGFDHRYGLALSNPMAWFKMDITIALKTVWVMMAGRGQ